MSDLDKNITIIIVTFKSQKVIEKCLVSIDNKYPVIVIENSNDENFKKFLENKFSNVKCILTGENIGMGPANNIGIKNATTDFVLISNPDVCFYQDTIKILLNSAERIKNFTILAPIIAKINNKFPNYGMFNKSKIEINEKFDFVKVDYVDGFAMLINKNKFLNLNFFDENFFMYLENVDICKRIKNRGENVYIIPNSKVDHLGASAVDPVYSIEVELSRNWHWMWSSFYYNKKHNGFFIAVLKILSKFFSSLVKLIFYFVTFNKIKKLIHKQRLSGIVNAIFGKKSWYRPKIPN